MRPQSQSLKVSNWLAGHAKDAIGHDATVLDLHQLELPMYTTEQEATDAVKTVESALESCDAAVFVSPEWNGMMSHGLANLQHYLGSRLAHKPVMLVGVSAGRGGSYPVMQMRSMGYKNNHYVISPESLLVQGVNDQLNDHDMSDEAEGLSVKKRADYALRILGAYAEALQGVRSSGVIDAEQFPNGM